MGALIRTTSRQKEGSGIARGTAFVIADPFYRSGGWGLSQATGSSPSGRADESSVNAII